MDVIVVSSSSEYLLEAICKAGGDSIKNSFDEESKKNPDARVVSVNAGGKLASKVIYFLPWKKNFEPCLLRKSIEKFVSDAMDKAIAENYQTIAFPAIGCGGLGCSVRLVAQAMVEEAHRKLQSHTISVSFIIQPQKTNIYDEFQKQIDLLQPQQQSLALQQSAQHSQLPSQQQSQREECAQRHKAPASLTTSRPTYSRRQFAPRSTNTRIEFLSDKSVKPSTNNDLVSLRWESADRSTKTCLSLLDEEPSGSTEQKCPELQEYSELQQQQHSQSHHLQTVKKKSVSIGTGAIEVEMGDITTQKVYIEVL